MQPLREDIYEAVKQHGFTAAACDQMHKLDSFLKESFRMNANQAGKLCHATGYFSSPTFVYVCDHIIVSYTFQVALQRIGRGPYKFSNG